MDRKEKNVYRRKDGRWEARYPMVRDENNNISKYGYVYAPSYEQVIIKRNVAVGLASVYEGNSDILFEELSEIWYQGIVLGRKDSTIAKYRNILKLHLLPYFGKMPVKDISNRDIEEFRIHLLTNGKKIRNGEADYCGLSQKSISDIMCVMRGIQKCANRYEIPTYFTMEGTYSRNKAKPIRILSITEQHLLYDYLRKNCSLVHIGIQLCLFTGIRIGELCALKWEDILLDEKLLNIRHTMYRIQVEGDVKKTKVVISSPKSETSIRKIPIPDLMLNQLISIQAPPDCFFLTATAERYMEPRALQKSFKHTLEKCGVENVNFHALRHTFATRCIEAGFDVKSLSEILGHADVNITLNRYAHPTLELKYQNMQKLSCFLADSLNTVQ